jgi:hypothetical protein
MNETSPMRLLPGVYVAPHTVMFKAIVLPNKFLNCDAQ